MRTLIIICLLLCCPTVGLADNPETPYLAGNSVYLTAETPCNPDNRFTCAALVLEGLTTYMGRNPNQAEIIAAVYYGELGLVHHTELRDVVLEAFARVWWDKQAGAAHCETETCLVNWLAGKQHIVDSAVMTGAGRARVNVARLLGHNVPGPHAYLRYLEVAQVVLNAPADWRSGTGTGVPGVWATMSYVPDGALAYRWFHWGGCEVVFVVVDVTARTSDFATCG